MLNPTLSLTQPKSLSLLFPLNPSTSAPWSPLVTTHRKVPHNRSKPVRLISTYRVKCINDLTVAPLTEVSVTAIVTVQMTIGGRFANLGLNRGLDGITDLLGKSLQLELVSAEIDPKTGKQWNHISAYARHKDYEHLDNEAKYEAEFKVPIGFGGVGAIVVENDHRKEMFLKNIVLVTDNDEASKITFVCDSWVHSKFDNPEKRIFFSVKSYLPSQTPKSLEDLRRKDLESLRGDGTGERKNFDRIYDYDVYNDLGDPDSKDGDMARPVLGGSKQFPYPRRCRTGRPRTKKDPHSERRSSNVYIPRDESFSEVKNTTFSAKTLRSVLHAVVPSLETAIYDTKLGFPYFTAIDSLYDEGVKLPEQEGLSFFRTLVPRIIKAVRDTTENVLLFETPEMINRDKFSWFRDEEFSRQTLAGLNPYSIKLLTELPIVSKLDPAIYGPPESLITPELIEREIKGAMTAQEAIMKKKLFILDYHDLLLPYVHKVRELDNTTLYSSRTVFFLTHENTLMPIAIELTRPASPTKPQWKQVFTDNWDATSAWLWKLAKTHVCAHDSGYHQLVSHWLRTHCCVEPYIIASNRQLSAMHPIYRLLHPHFRYTMEINALAREALISAGGIIERSFSPRKYSMELSSVAYDLEWQFDMEALPADLIRRGMAVEDPKAEHGLRLTIEDYPFANDGLLIWTSTKQWVTDYVNHYYETPNDVLQDSEIQEWWLEIRTKGHADKKDEPWWPKLENQDDLIQILTTIIWVTSGHHAAVNFGQYHYAGYFPNRPTIARTNMPVEDEVPNSESFKKFWRKPEDALMECFPSQIQATVVMAVLDILSSHSPDEEYISEKPELVWKSDPVINAAFERFNGRMKEIEGIIDDRNLDTKLMNRCGAGIVPYELLKPFSGPGVTGKGIPNSISI
ncbi:linoleate 13S-lipoxygenase 2-1 [Carex littledalei]|uniref:Lipoxygenase n=1 Tax=Carex littledalei TaxID=544730 RepID=A0A833QSH7_9POAL|nr:linoleate 13S-lipoxygenase 2-1 [Carex littledalei]